MVAAGEPPRSRGNGPVSLRELRNLWEGISEAVL